MNSFLKNIKKEFLIASRAGLEVLMPVMYLFIIMVFFNISISYVEKDIIVVAYTIDGLDILSFNMCFKFRNNI